MMIVIIFDNDDDANDVNYVNYNTNDQRLNGNRGIAQSRSGNMYGLP